MSALSTASEALATARAVVEAVEAETYTTLAAYEAAANEARTALDVAMLAIDVTYGASGFALLLAMESVAARLLDLREAINTEAATVEQSWSRVTSLLEIAVESYADFERWTDLAELNPHLPHPGFIPAGREVVRHVA